MKVLSQEEQRLCRVACDYAEKALPTYLQEYPESYLLREGIDVTRRFLAGDATKEALLEIQKDLDELVTVLEVKARQEDISYAVAGAAMAAWFATKAATPSAEWPASWAAQRAVWVSAWSLNVDPIVLLRQAGLVRA